MEMSLITIVLLIAFIIFIIRIAFVLGRFLQRNETADIIVGGGIHPRMLMNQSSNISGQAYATGSNKRTMQQFTTAVSSVLGIVLTAMFLMNQFKAGDSPVHTVSLNTSSAASMVLPDITEKVKTKLARVNQKPSRRAEYKPPKTLLAIDNIQYQNYLHREDIIEEQPHRYSIQVVACKAENFARSTATEYAAELNIATHIYHSEDYHKVLIGKFKDRASANSYKQALEREKGKRFLLVNMESITKWKLESI